MNADEQTVDAYGIFVDGNEIHVSGHSLFLHLIMGKNIKEFYETPTMEVVAFQAEGVICESNQTTGNPEDRSLIGVWGNF